MSGAEHGTDGLRGAARLAVASLVDIGRNRLELATVEIEQERLRLAQLWIVSACTLFFSFLAVTLLCAWVVLVTAPSQRPHAAAALAGLFVLAGLVCGWRWRTLQQQKPRLLKATLDELRADCATLRP